MNFFSDFLNVADNEAPLRKSLINYSLAIALCFTVAVAPSANANYIDTAMASPFLVELAENGSLGGGPTPPTRPLSTLAISLIAGFEGFEPRLYNDPAGHCTIGYGHLVKLGNCDDAARAKYPTGISTDQAWKLLTQDAALAGSAAQNLSGVSLTDGQLGALGSFIFNFGQGKYASSTLRKAVLAEAHGEAPRQFRRWVYARNENTGQLEKLRGLEARRNCEAVLYQDLLASPFDRSSCEGVFAAGGVAEAEPIDVFIGELAIE